MPSPVMKRPGRLTEDWQTRAALNCPRIICLRDATLLIFGDFHLLAEDHTLEVLPLVWRSRDNGATWEGPETLAVPQAGYQPAPAELRDGRLLLGQDIPDQGPRGLLLGRSGEVLERSHVPAGHGRGPHRRGQLRGAG